MRIEEHLEGVALDSTLLDKLYDGFRIRQQNFGNTIYFHSPGFKHYQVDDFKVSSAPKFVDVSITGRHCELMCDHCASKILWHMIPATSPEELIRVGQELKAKGIEGILISGGSNKDGVVELNPFLKAMRYLKEELGMLVTCHVGLVDRELAEGLREAGVDAVLLDIIGDDRTIAEVYKMPHKSVKDYEMSLKNLKDFGHSIVPHVIIGLHYGKILGEYRAIDMVSDFEPSALVLVVVMPYYGKAKFQLLPPPKAEESAMVILHARKKLPSTHVVIGCARPAGEERVKLDIYALHAGVNGITFPAEGVFSYAKSMGLEPVVSQNCCSTVFMPQ
ncbi:Radical SAM domain protein [Hydrogenobacter thermophilus TK-6]|uniref:Radical SAM domain protein n=1 Tax=Hydrogenobacter thermophilus (strain DSM 6534 / IAM 12695 / TK-6) TaxID=608538 RepID=D3DKG5_HYDTT|nr:radical SAM protein [Hydrogenobacter thermophilus]ADO46235.1 Radical SAM domain protein [Hydrogenobacter thermophilus TK-6]BAI70317.1 radical SAM domain protein [Hydrogenobacter thermophilus TK-6]